MIEAAAEPRVEPNRGVYNARRAAALAGVPLRTLSYWAQTGLYRPSIAPQPRTRLWSWADLLALRAIDWLRRKKGEGEPLSVNTAQIRRALAQLDAAGYAPSDLHRLVLVSQGGVLFLKTEDALTVKARPGQQILMPDTLKLVPAYLGKGPDLLIPRPMLRILPGKLHGEPHVQETRIASATLFALHDAGYTMEQIRSMYPQASPEAIKDAIDLEQSLNRSAA